MAVHGSVAAENQDRIRLACVRGQPKLPLRIRDSCKGLQMSGRGMQTENGGDSHFVAEINKL